MTLIISFFFCFLIYKDLILELNFSDFYNYYLNLKVEIDRNKIFFIFFYFVLSVFWIFLFGFVSPLLVISTLMFGYLGCLISVISFTLGSTFSFLAAKSFKKSIKKILKKNEINENSLFLFIIFRLIPGVPFIIKNFSGVFFKINVYKFFLATLIAETPQIFLFTFILKKLINTSILLSDDFNLMLLSQELFIPIITLLLFAITIFGIKKYFQKYF
ncbi:MAG: hypothetical protein CBC25_02785 [Pelagibacteraceae bacterium TMED65]|nr:hypothetical protein [Rickettsiales bacterium]OUU52474.1 MAG: hypothetical protein CBC25_02785 [Pelagibacteraceae bacterium TMED65]